MEKEIFKSNQHFVSCDQILYFLPEKIFPLLCPKREYDWIETWRGNIIFSKSGFAESDCIFTTEFPGDPKETWVVDIYEKNEKIQFVRFSESRIIRYCISLIGNKDGTTTAKWEQTITSLTAEGNTFIRNFSDQEFKLKINGLEKMLNHYLGTGQMLKITR